VTPQELYDQIGGGYGAHRRPDPRVAAAIVRALGDADTVLNVGAGAGSYEPADRTVVAVEPSLAMIRQRGKGSPPVIQASATHLPFRAGAFAASLAVLTVHHWPDRGNGLAELKRVARRRVVLFTWDPASPGFWLTDEYFPEERRDRWIWRGKKVVIECQKHADYQASVRWVLDAIDAWALRAVEVGKDSKQGEGLLPAGTLAQDPSLRSALSLLRTLLERIANAPLDPIFDAARVLAKDAANDEGLRTWWKNVDEYIRKVLLQVGYITEDASNTRARELRDTGRMFYNDKYKNHFDALSDAMAGWFKSLAEDPLNKALAQDFARLTRDLLFDSEGNLQFKKKLWEDVRGVILPTLVDKVGVIPIPRVEYTDDSLDLVVENLTLSGRHLFPNVVEIDAHNFVRFSPYTAAAKGDASRHEFTFTFAQIHADMRDVAFSFRTKTGIKMRDSGLADVVLGGEGLTATVTLTSSKDTSSVFHVANVRVKVGSLKFRLRDTKHDSLYKILKPLATRLIKKQIQKALADAIRTGFEYVDGQLVGVRDRMDEAKGSDDGSRREVLAELFKRKKEDAASTASSVTKNSQFKVVASKDQSLLPNSGHPDGWVNRTAEKKGQLAADQRDDWRSDAFDIKSSKGMPGSQQTTTSKALPGAPQGATTTAAPVTPQVAKSV